MDCSQVLPTMATTPAGTSAQMIFYLGMLYNLGREVEQDYVAIAAL
jgi:hypothetical protein